MAAALQDRLSVPSEGLVRDMEAVGGDILILGAGGKLGPSLATLAINACRSRGDNRRVIAVSRFSEAGVAEALTTAGVEVVRADLSDSTVLDGLCDAANVIYLVGAKFGSSGQEARAWDTNAYLPARVARRYKTSRMVVLSTGNVYPFVDISSGGATEETPLHPIGDYAMSCVGRERLVEHVSREFRTPAVLIRLNYAVEMRYGVLVDIARAIMEGRPIDLGASAVNLVWQGYANEVIIRSLRIASSPPLRLNVTGPETVSVRYLAEALGHELEMPVTFAGSESPTALLSNATLCHTLFGYPSVTLGELVRATGEWIRAGRELFDKQTKFERRDGRF